MKEEWRALQSIADTAEPELRAALQRWVTRLKRALPETTLAQLAVLQTPQELLIALERALEESEAAFAHELSALLHATQTAAALTALPFLPRVATLVFDFNRTNPRAVEWARQHAAALVTGISAETRQAIQLLLLRAFEEGIPPRALARLLRAHIGLTPIMSGAVVRLERSLRTRGGAEERVQEIAAAYATRLLSQRAETIARTETIRASSMGQQELWRQAVAQRLLVPAQTQRVWIVTPDDRLCQRICAPMRGQRVALEEEFTTGIGSKTLTPPAHPRCLTGETLVRGPTPLASTTRWYEGPLVELLTASGNFLRATPNHPILTERGWQPAELLQEGECVLTRRWKHAATAATVDVDQQQGATLQEIAETLGSDRGMTTSTRAVSPEHFHGDGRYSQVYIVRTDRLFQKRLRKPLMEKAGVGGDASASMLHGTSGAQTSLQRRGMSARGRIRSLRLMSPLLWSSLRILDGLSFAPSTKVDVQLSQSMRERVPAHREDEAELKERLAREIPLNELSRFNQGARRTARAYPHTLLYEEAPEAAGSTLQLARQLLEGITGTIERDRLVSVRRRSFSGHVYNLQTTGGWYIGNNIITHNCRCAIGLVLGVPPVRAASFPPAGGHGDFRPGVYTG